MSHAISSRGKALIGVLALTLGGLGAAQLAFGHDISDRSQPLASANHDVNRSGKTDRAARVTMPAVPTQTISVTLSGLRNTSVAMRIPLTDTRTSAPASLLIRSTPPKPAVACEPVVSALTEVAKLLQPGRCFT